jgi:hypothetical protein
VRQLLFPLTNNSNKKKKKEERRRRPGSANGELEKVPSVGAMGSKEAFG